MFIEQDGLTFDDRDIRSKSMLNSQMNILYHILDANLQMEEMKRKKITYNTYFDEFSKEKNIFKRIYWHIKWKISYKRYKQRLKKSDTTINELKEAMHLIGSSKTKVLRAAEYYTLAYWARKYGFKDISNRIANVPSSYIKKYATPNKTRFKELIEKYKYMYVRFREGPPAKISELDELKFDATDLNLHDEMISRKNVRQLDKKYGIDGQQSAEEKMEEITTNFYINKAVAYIEKWSTSSYLKTLFDTSLGTNTSLKRIDALKSYEDQFAKKLDEFEKYKKYINSPILLENIRIVEKEGEKFKINPRIIRDFHKKYDKVGLGLSLLADAIGLLTKNSDDFEEYGVSLESFEPADALKNTRTKYIVKSDKIIEKFRKKHKADFEIIERHSDEVYKYIQLMIRVMDEIETAIINHISRMEKDHFYAKRVKEIDEQSRKLAEIETDSLLSKTIKGNIEEQTEKLKEEQRKKTKEELKQEKKAEQEKRRQKKEEQKQAKRKQREERKTAKKTQKTKGTEKNDASEEELDQIENTKTDDNAEVSV